jgi:glycosyltransferase involved in cell wall biosynthesis
MDNRLFDLIKGQFIALLNDRNADIDNYKFINNRKRHIPVYIYNEPVLVIHLCKFKLDDIKYNSKRWNEYKLQIVNELHCNCDECKITNEDPSPIIDITTNIIKKTNKRKPRYKYKKGTTINLECTSYIEHEKPIEVYNPSFIYKKDKNQYINNVCTSIVNENDEIQINDPIILDNFNKKHNIRVNNKGFKSYIINKSKPTNRINPFDRKHSVSIVNRLQRKLPKITFIDKKNKKNNISSSHIENHISNNSTTTKYNTNNDSKFQILTYKNRPKGNRIRVLYLVNSTLPFNICGYTIRSHNVVKSIRRSNIDILIVDRLIVSNIDKIQEIKYNGLSYVLLKTKKRVRIFDKISIYSNEYIEEYKNKLEQFCRLYKPDIIHTCSNYINPIVGIEVSNKLGIPCLYEVRGFWNISRLSYEPEWENTSSYIKYCNLELECYNKVNKILALNNTIKDYIIDQGVNEEKFIIVRNGVDTQLWKPTSINNNLKGKYNITNHTVFGYIGSIVEYEGLDLLIKATSLLISNGYNIKVIIVGKGNTHNVKLEFDRLVELTNDLGLTDDIIFTGQIPIDDIKDYYSIIDIICIPRYSKLICELVTPLKIFEAMSMKKVVIASNVSPMEEVIKDKINGLLHIKDDYNSLADTMSYIIDNSELIDIIGDNARQYVIDNNKWDYTTSDIIKLYRELVR